MGRSELQSCKGLIRQALVHLLKQHAWPASRLAAHWRAEAVGFLADAAHAFTPSMRQRIDLAEIHERALMQAAAETDDTGAPHALPPACPCSLDELLAGHVPEFARRLP